MWNIEQTRKHFLSLVVCVECKTSWGNEMTAPIHQPPDGVPRRTTQTVGMGVEILDRMERAVAKVRERLLRATSALNQAGLPYAVVGGNAVASWVATIDEGAVRNTARR